ncbi:MAG: TAT-variant-translocated molybdopterin oxidoreductase [Isosphaeraceae bacterium]|nr:TAT-variant-translocated molybdopterin oxidoreductase [Isosphaeraceae bacterium]
MNMHPRKTGGPDLAALRARLADETGPRYWRSLDELAETEEFQEFLHREFPVAASEWTDPASRRTFLQLMGASLALAGVGLSGCAQQGSVEKIVPYVRMPEQIVPGKPLKYASAVTLGGYALGVVAETHEGRPTMLEGNEQQPDSLGAVNPFVQASLLGLYDPDRSQVVTRAAKGGREISTLDLFVTAAVAALDAQRPKKGAGLHILTETVTSPTLARLIRTLLAEFPEAKWHQYEPAGGDAARLGARLAFGQDVATRYHFDKADLILSLDADFLARGPGHLRYAREFGLRREPKNMNRLYVVESTPTITGSMADHRLPLPARAIEGFARGLAQALGVKVAGSTAADQKRWVDALARDLQAHKGACLIVAGETQPPAVHALAHALNEALGNVGKTVEYSAPVEANPVDQNASLRALAKALDPLSDAKPVEMLLILGGNPAYYAPADLDFEARLANAPFSAHLSLYEDETSVACGWHVPKAHELETWGDARGSDGTATIQQPLIAPLYDGRSMPELLAALLRHPSRSGYELVRDTWKELHKDADFETFWRTALHEGVVAGTALPVNDVKVKSDLALGDGPAAAEGLELTFQVDPTIGDGRSANNGWLQELPKPISKLAWGNAALVSPKTAQRLSLTSEDVVFVRYQGRSLQAPVWVTPGQADESIAIALGHGRTRAGRVGNRIGFNAYALRTSDAPWFGSGTEVITTGRTMRLACTQNHRPIERGKDAERDDIIEGREEQKREIYRVATLADFLKDPHFAHDHGHEEAPGQADTLYHDDFPYNGHSWGMSVNLNSCIGCNACVVACQAENNIPVVGREQVIKGREMHWIDLDRYYHGSIDNPETYHQPRFCMHCENAPCELVCPVAATVHDAEGLNNMIYNRCVGTRYCSNNCPYKVRHFNFLHFADLTGVYNEKNPPSLKLLNNPDVSVRARGVMEKCTYCVQRINAARYTAEEAGQPLRDGDVVTACQAACPTRAIVFGDINDKGSRVAQLKADPRDYGMLADLNTRPRTTYIAKLRNPNPELETTEGAA